MTDLAHNEPSADDLAHDWLFTKQKIAKLQKDLKQIEEKLIPFCTTVPEGSRSTDLPGGHKVTVKRGLNRTMNWKAWREIKEQIPKKLHPVELKEALSVPGLKWLEQNEPDLYAVVAQALTVKPSKPSFDVRAPVVEEVA